MLVRTCGGEYKKKGILLNAVDTGWVTEEHPQGWYAPGFKPPLDIVDGAARIVAPIFDTINSKSNFGMSGKFFKDYLSTTW